MTRDELLALIDQAERENWTELDLSNKGLTELPPEIGRLTDLAKLNLEGNKLSTLPLQIINLANLIELNINGNLLIEVLPEIKYLTQLEKLHIGRDWNYGGQNQLTKLPPEIGYLTKLTELRLDGNKLAELPQEISLLQNLKSLILGDLNPSNRDLTNLPEKFTHLQQLEEFYISYTGFNHIPEAVFSSFHLKELGLQGLPLHFFPHELLKLTNLEKLLLDDTNIATLPKEIENLKELRVLGLNIDTLTSLPEEIGNLSKLEGLFLACPKLLELPVSLGGLEKLKIRNLHALDNLQFPPPEIAGIGESAIMRYLKSAYSGNQKLWESKCLLIGEGGVGKTTLFEVLNDRPYDQHESGTVGIEIGPLVLPHLEKEDVTMRLNCWDFAGQDFNHAMHQFFFSNRALFLLVWNARHGWQQGKLYRWLENIKVRAPEAKVILVATHTDQPHSDYPAADLQAKYPQIVETIEVSSKTGDNIPELRQLIQKHAADLPLMGLRWPQTWLDAANAVRAMCQSGQKHASRREVVEVMKEHDLNEEECGILMRWLHELGDILHFDDEPEMRGRVILDPEWLTQHIGIVLRSDEVQQQNGILTRQHLNTLWPDLDDYLQDHFLRMMDKFDLAYLIPDDPQDRSLIVERLPLDPPDYTPKWQEFEERGNEISLRFKLGSMQPGIPTWFIARCHRFTMNTHWLNGVLFKDEDDRHRALIMADDKDNIVQMTVRGPFPQRFMALLRDGFRDTLKRYKGLEVTRWVPCPSFNELENQPCQNEFRLDSLENWLEQKPERVFFHCPECDSELSRLQLVEGIGAAALTQQLTEKRMAELLNEAHTKTRKEIKDHIDYRIEDVLRYQQRNFLRAFYLEQDREMVTCPNLFTIRQVPKKGVVKKQEWQIQLYCQQPGAWHSVGEPYIIEEHKEWFTKALPYLKTLLKVLSVVAPLANAALAITDVVGDRVQVARDQHTIFENEVKMMGELLKGTKVVAEMERPLGERIYDQPERSTFRKAEGAELVPIRDLMDQLAAIDEQKGRPKWAGLTRRQTPEGDILWLDEEHLQEYLSKRKPVPQPEDFE